MLAVCSGKLVRSAEVTLCLIGVVAPYRESTFLVFEPHGPVGADNRCVFGIDGMKELAGGIGFSSQPENYRSFVKEPTLPSGGDLVAILANLTFQGVEGVVCVKEAPSASHQLDSSGHHFGVAAPGGISKASSNHLQVTNEAIVACPGTAAL